MLLGNLSLGLALVFALVSAIFFLRGTKGDEKLLNMGRKTYYAFLFFTFLASAYLIYLFLSHQFQVEYVYNHSSFTEPFWYLISAFWAGQEGSFLLWLFFGSLLGVFVTSGKKKSVLYSKESGISEGYVMFFYLLIQMFFLVMLLKMSPFSLLPDVPSDGKGLNPLLKDFWMVIHPPVLFVGYAALAVPFAYALAALVKNRYEGWTRFVLPWAGFSCLTLGAGIFIGAYWAYKVLGWGGYWGWDPVENASLVPWLLSIALIHGLVLERTRGVLRRTNLFLAILPFLLVIYATFLVRSGVLGEFSVHSFADLGISAYLLAFMIFFFLLSIGLYLLRLSHIPQTEISKNILSTEFLVITSIIFLNVSALLILLGTSSPLITSIFGPASNVNIPYYVWTQIPLTILVTLLLGVVPFFSWKGLSLNEFTKSIRASLVIAVGLTVLAFAFKVRSPIYLICIFAASLAFVANLFVLVKRGRGGLKFIGGFLTHVGVGLLLVGIVTSSGYDKSRKISLPRDQTEEVFGYRFTYLGMESSSLGENDVLKIEVQKGNKHFMARPKYYFSEYNQGIMRTPHIKIKPLYDLYLTPLEHTQGEGSEEDLFQIRKGETLEEKGYTIRFLDFDLSSHAQPGQVSVGAVLEVERNGEKATLTPTMAMGGIEESQIKRMVHLPGGEDHLVLEKIDADRKTVALRLILETEKTSEDLLILSVSKKPLINLFWLGTIV
ncbi:MAG: heme lyase CcmF/NrfE family subunit, partial [Candidatus Zixiibacteriota bacterium]